MRDAITNSKLERELNEMTEHKKHPKEEHSKKNLGIFMVTDPEKAVRDVKRKEAEKEDEEE